MIAILIRLLTGAQARWVGCAPEDTQRVYFANHASNLDGPVIWASLHPRIRHRTRLVAARDYWDAGPLRRFVATRIFDALLINRRRVTRDDHPIADMEAALDAGSSLIIFPEGGRRSDEDGVPAPFKSGIHRLAIGRPELEFVPVHLRNLDRILPKGEFLPVPVMASVAFGTPLRLRPDEDRAAFLERARNAIIELGAQEES